MSRSVICHACGQRLEADDDYKRNKIQCSCGVFCDLPQPKPDDEAFPPAPRRAAPTPPVTLPEPAKEPPRRPAPAGPVSSRTELTTRGKGLGTCPNCGELIRPILERGKPGKCPNCGAPVTVPPPPKRAKAPIPALRDDHVPSAPPPVAPTVPPPVLPKPVRRFVDDDDDDGRPYQVHSTGEKQCPGCQREQPPDTVICPKCGFDFELGCVPEKIYEPVFRTWDSGMAPAKRLTLFIAAQCVTVPLFLLGAWMNGSLFVAVAPWGFFTFLTSFLLGTWDRLEFRRNEQGKLRLTQTWHICFVPKPPTRIKLYAYEGIATGVDHEVGCWEWFIFLSLLGFFLIPGLMWWYHVIQRYVYFVALTKDHGFPERMIYRGRDKDQAFDIAATLRDEAEMPWEQGEAVTS